MSYDENLAARQLLLYEMREWSEKCFSAGWMRDLGFDLWNIVVNDGGFYGWHMFSLVEVKRLYRLAVAADGWWRWGEADEEFVSLDAWRNIYSNQMNRRGSTDAELEKENERLRRHVMVLKRALGWLDTVLDFGHQDGGFSNEFDQSDIEEAYAYAYEVVCGRIVE